MSEERTNDAKTPGKKPQDSPQFKTEPKESRPPDTVKEEVVSKKEEKRALSKLAAETKLTPARVYVIMHHTGWTDNTLVSRSEFEAAVNKHLKGKEA